MNNFYFFCILSLLSCSNNETKKEKVKIKALSTSLNSIEICVDFNSLNIKIRDALIPKQEGISTIQQLIPQITSAFYKNGGKKFKNSDWVFPVQGYDSKSIGGKAGNGYIVSGYDYFDGNKHKGHPAQDIFINDRNQDCMDDIKMKSVNVLSMTGGIVIATAKDWDTTSDLRGGKYIWIYDPASNSFFYYAHNSKVLVQTCDIVIPGDVIATVGRSGYNAFNKRSPTHLHLMQLKLDKNYYPKPVNCYSDLIKISH